MSFRSAISAAIGRVDLAGQVLDAGEVVLVRVPAAEGDLDERHADLDQPAGHQAAVAEAAGAVLRLRLAVGSGDRSNAFASFDCISLTARS